MAAYIDALRDKQWPQIPAAASRPPRTDEEKNETRERAHNLINARCRRQQPLKVTVVLLTLDVFFFPCRFKPSCPQEDGHGVCLYSFSGQ